MNPEKYAKFEDDNELGDKNISLENKPKGSEQISHEEKKNPPRFLKKLIDNKEDVAASYIAKNSTNVTEEFSKSIINSFNDKLQFIGKYFNVEVEDIKNKLVSAVMPMNRNFHTLAEPSPDLYGPFWIYATLVFILTLAGNLSNFLESDNKEDFRYNFNFIPNAAMIIYSMGFGVPLLLFLLMKFVFKVDIPLVLNICVYGYSYTILIPILLICVIPIDIIQFILLGYYLVASSFFLVYNMYNFIVEKAQKSKYVILGILIGAQALQFLIFKFYFFGSVTKSL